MWAYLLNSLAWSGVGLFSGAVIAELGYDLTTLLRNSGRRNHRDDT